MEGGRKLKTSPLYITTSLVFYFTSKSNWGVSVSNPGARILVIKAAADLTWLVAQYLTGSKNCINITKAGIGIISYLIHQLPVLLGGENVSTKV